MGELSLHSIKGLMARIKREGLRIEVFNNEDVTIEPGEFNVLGLELSYYRYEYDVEFIISEDHVRVEWSYFGVGGFVRGGSLMISHNELNKVLHALVHALNTGDKNELINTVKTIIMHYTYLGGLSE
jgi:hypothetical protein